MVEDAAAVIAEALSEGARRDPKYSRAWVALVEGNNNHQISRIKAEAKLAKAKMTIAVGLVHVMTYLWDAEWCLRYEREPVAETWVGVKALHVLEGNAGLVAGAIRRKATNLHLSPSVGKNADTCASYLRARAPYLDYPTALTNGWPVATGIIESGCRYLVNDRMALSGARWRLKGAETVLKLRAIHKNGDWASYYSFHLAQERKRAHEPQYISNVIPLA